MIAPSMKPTTTLSLLMVLFSMEAPSAERPVGPKENVVVVGALPTFVKLDGIDCVRLSVNNVNTSETVYICYRHRRPNDFKIGSQVYGCDSPVTATEPTGVIHRIILESFDPESSKDHRSFAEIPPELYHDVSEGWFGAQARSPFGLARKGSMLTLCLEGGDGCASYTANWIIDLHTKSVRRVMADSEEDAGLSSPWLNLKKIAEPKIVDAPNGATCAAKELISQQDAMAVIRKQLALALSANKEQASLADALAACRRLAAPSFIIDLLSDPKYGWKRMAPATLCHNDNSYTFVPFTYRVHEALFERWGELDLEGALKSLPPSVTDGDFDEGLVITFNLYKGAASVRNGKDIFDRLIPSWRRGDGYSEYDSCALEYLMEGWARSDPDAAWAILVSHPSVVNAGRGAIRGYFKGLNARTSWEKLARKVEAYCAKDPFIAGAEAKGEFRRGLASAWLRHDPAAALAWFASNCNDPHPNYSCEAEDVRVVVHAVIITEWLKDDLAGATRWLATWKSERISPAKVLAYIAAKQKNLPPLNANPKLREAVEKLIRERND